MDKTWTFLFCVLCGFSFSCKNETREIFSEASGENLTYWEYDSIFQSFIFEKLNQNTVRNYHLEDAIDVYRCQTEICYLDPLHREIYTVFQINNEYFLNYVSIKRPYSTYSTYLKTETFDSFEIELNILRNIEAQDFRELKELLEITEYYDLMKEKEVGFDGEIIIIESKEYFHNNRFEYHKLARHSPKPYEAAFQIAKYFKELKMKYESNIK